MVRTWGFHVVIGSMGGAPAHPPWGHNLRPEAAGRLQDGANVQNSIAHELTGPANVVIGSVPVRVADQHRFERMPGVRFLLRRLAIGFAAVVVAGCSASSSGDAEPPEETQPTTTEAEVADEPVDEGSEHRFVQDLWVYERLA